MKIKPNHNNINNNIWYLDYVVWWYIVRTKNKEERKTRERRAQNKNE